MDESYHDLKSMKDKWTSQQIHKRKKNQAIPGVSQMVRRKSARKWGSSSNSLTKIRHRWWQSGSPNKRRIYSKIDNDICNNIMHQHKYSNIYEDLILYPIQQNLIPIWICSRCTYRNIERKSFCSMCHLSYSCSTSRVPSSQYLPSEKSSDCTTLPQFCQNAWNALSIPVWICSNCTYCNIEQLPQCKICQNPYSLQSETEQYNDNDQVFSFDNKQNENKSTNKKKKKGKSKTDPRAEKIKLNVTMKLCPNRLYSAKLPYFDKDIEDLTHHTLIECELEIKSSRNELLSKTKLLPSLCYRTKYVALNYKVIIPIQYAYKRHTYFKGKIDPYCKHIYVYRDGIWGRCRPHPSECKQSASFDGYGGRSTSQSYTFDNRPLASIAKYVANARYPHLNEREWGFIENEDDDHYYSPVWSYQLMEVLLEYLPLKDVLNHILFKYLGYDQIDIVKMTTNIIINVDYFRKFKNIHQKEKKIFLRENDDYLPFKIYDTKYSKIRQRNCYNFQLFEIGYHKKHIIKKKKENKPAVKKKEIAKTFKTKQNRKDAKRASLRKRDIKQFYPKKYLLLRSLVSNR